MIFSVSHALKRYIMCTLCGKYRNLRKFAKFLIFNFVEVVSVYGKSKLTRLKIDKKNY